MQEPTSEWRRTGGTGPGTPANSAESRVGDRIREADVRREIGFDGEHDPFGIDGLERRLVDAVSGYEEFVASVRRTIRHDASDRSLSAEPVARDADRSPPALLREIDVPVRIELGRTRLPLREVLRLDPGSVVELDRAVEDPFDVRVNGEPIARGEILVLDHSYCLRITEVLDRPARGAELGPADGGALFSELETPDELSSEESSC